MKNHKKSDVLIALDFVFDLYITKGHRQYHGESVSILEHSLQTAKLAQKANSKKYVILAAFLHDIGNLILEAGEDNTINHANISHEKIGAIKILDLGFSEKIAQLVHNHVQAKRYLVSKFPRYLEKLSIVSFETLKVQGGKMDNLEMQVFERMPQFKNSLMLRIWDDEAKVPNQHIPDLSFYYNLAQEHLIANAKTIAKKKN